MDGNLCWSNSNDGALGEFSTLLYLERTGGESTRTILPMHALDLKKVLALAAVIPVHFVKVGYRSDFRPWKSGEGMKVKAIYDISSVIEHNKRQCHKPNSRGHLVGDKALHELGCIHRVQAWYMVLGLNW